MWKVEWISKFPEPVECGDIDVDLIEYDDKVVITKKRAIKIAERKGKINGYSIVVQVEPDYIIDDGIKYLLGYNEIGEREEIVY